MGCAHLCAWPKDGPCQLVEELEVVNQLVGHLQGGRVGTSSSSSVFETQQQRVYAAAWQHAYTNQTDLGQPLPLMKVVEPLH